jgi:hypothetical protein
LLNLTKLGFNLRLISNSNQLINIKIKSHYAY